MGLPSVHRMDSEHILPSIGGASFKESAGDSGTCTKPPSAQLRKGSTQISLDSPINAQAIANTNANKRGSGSTAGNSADPTNAFQPFVPDYTIKAVSDVLYAKITRATYLVSPTYPFRECPNT